MRAYKQIRIYIFNIYIFIQTGLCRVRTSTEEEEEEEGWASVSSGKRNVCVWMCTCVCAEDQRYVLKNQVVGT